jgi:spermidine dehydrogenase
LRKARPALRVLILDNHDDFGGHARRNEFDIDGRLRIGYGGSESMEGPKTRWTGVARACVASLGVDLDRFETAFQLHLYPGLGLSSGLFFPRETYGVDRLVTGDPVRSLPSDTGAPAHARPAAAFLADCPVADAQKARLLEPYMGNRDVLAGHEWRTSSDCWTSYHDYLQRYFRLDTNSLAMFDGRTLDLLASKATAVSALWAWECEYPGFQGLGLKMPKSGVLEGDPYIYHFPAGNASLARLFVRALIPAAAAGRSMDDIVTARFDYQRLDVPGMPHACGSPRPWSQCNNSKGVDVLYAQGERVTRVHADHPVYAGYPRCCRISALTLARSTTRCRFRYERLGPTLTSRCATGTRGSTAGSITSTTRLASTAT